MNIFVTGVAGYIGSHVCEQLLKTGYNVIGIDNFYNSDRAVLQIIKDITNRDIRFYEGDVCNEKLLTEIFESNKIDAVIDFVAYKSIAESIIKPLDYYANNLVSLLTLCKVMNNYNVKNLIYSSSATVYGADGKMPLDEEAPVGKATNPYGQTKLMCEQILKDLYISDKLWNISLLRYFNPIGASDSGKLGEDPLGVPNNLVPYVARVAAGQLDEVKVYGNDYPTKDGTGIRDYIHVVDLALGHIKALEKINNSGLQIYNLGTGKGYSVLDVIHEYEKAAGVKIKYKCVGRRDGDVAVCYADPTKAKEELKWTTERNLFDMCNSSWRYINWKYNNK